MKPVTESTGERRLGTITGMCRECRTLLEAKIVAAGGSVYQVNECACGYRYRAKIADDESWYRDVIGVPVTTRESALISHPVQKGCPYDCGICPGHENSCNLPVFSITNACNLGCPICFTYNRKDKLYFMSEEEIGRIMDFILECEPEYDLINITGGEPTLHPELFSLLERCRRPEIGRITMNTNGIRLAADEALCEKLKEMGIYVILSFDTLKADTSIKIHGQDIVDIKLKALDNLEKYDIGTTLLNVMAAEVNDDEIGSVIDLAVEKKNVRSVTIQTMTFTGHGGGQFTPRTYMPIDGAQARIEQTTGGMVRSANFFPHPAAHSLCYSVGYFFRAPAPRNLISFTEMLSPQELRSILGGRYFMHPDGEFESRTQEAIMDMWTRGQDKSDVFRNLKRLMGALYPPGTNLSPFERQRIAEREVLTIYIHAHMDEDNLDLGRLKLCTDLVPDVNRTFVPACAYNLFYRMKDERFWVDKKEDGGKS